MSSFGERELLQHRERARKNDRAPYRDLLLREGLPAATLDPRAELGLHCTELSPPVRDERAEALHRLLTHARSPRSAQPYSRS